VIDATLVNLHARRLILEARICTDWCVDMMPLCEILLRNPAAQNVTARQQPGRAMQRDTGGDSNIIAAAGQRRSSWIVRDESRSAPGQSIDELESLQSAVDLPG
jgi:hypothetical protein